DLEDLIRIEAAHADAHRALRQLQLRDAVVQVEHGHARARVEAHDGAADLELGARTVIDPEPVANGQRTVDVGLDPVVFAGGRKANRAGRVAKPYHTGRRIGTGEATHRQHGHTRCESQAPEA